MNIVFLHHSTGGVIWEGNTTSRIAQAARRVSDRLAAFLTPKAQLPTFFNKYNKKTDKNYLIEEMSFPKHSPYGWNNDPFDYYNIWVKNAGEEPFMEEPTLEILTKKYQVIIFKHCFPVCNIQSEQDSADINSNIKTLSNYKLQYTALMKKLHQFPDTKFILWTGAAQVKSAITEDEAIRAKEFFRWTIEEWDQPDDNIFIWNFYHLETDGGLYLKDEYAVSPSDSHPNQEFAGRVVDLLFNRVIDVIENSGQGTTLTGQPK
ncbi:MAG: hypothetical protein JXC36_09695 [Candidatus Atribacteria bacterium]|nr:hypothetical protein [Candidatus Atribacteria bacterium]